MEKIKNFFKNPYVMGFIAGGAMLKLVEILREQECAVFTVCMIAIAIIMIILLRWKIKGDKVKKGRLLIILVVIVLLFLVGTYHKLYCHTDNTAIEQAITTEMPEDTDETPEEDVETPDDTNTNVSASVSNPYISRYTGKSIGWCQEKDKMETTHNSSEKTSSEKDVEIITKDADEELPVIEINPDVEEIKKEAEEEGKDIKDLDNGVVAIVDNQEVEEETEEDKSNTKKVDINTDEAVEIDNNEEIEDVNEQEEIVEEHEKATSEDLEDLFNKTTTETEEETEVTVVNTEKTVEEANTTLVVEDLTVEVEDVTDENVTFVETEEVETVSNVQELEETELTVEAIDGYTTNVGSSVQFSISDSTATIEGLDGIDYTFSNGILTIDAGNEATVLTVCVSNSSSSVEFDITVNGVLN